jgi:protein-S-isoprenylcysteine O-methyltransferase Ste14
MLTNLVYIWISIAVFAFVYLVFKPAPYGRHATRGWGPLLKSRIAWLIMETPVFMIVLTYLAINFQTITWAGRMLMMLFLLHYFNRCFIYPFRLPSRQNKMPLTIVLSAVLFNLVNGNILGYYFTTAGSNPISDPEFIIGCVTFFVGMIINITSDETLLTLKRKSDQYAIPHGGFYHYISCPNYFGELLEWLGFAIAAGHLASWSFFIWSFANLAPRALAHHKWYRQTFADYPEKRKALIPLLW